MDIITGFPSTMMDDYQLNIIDILRYAAETYHSQKVISRISDNKTISYTYKELLERVSKLAHGLVELGVKQGERIGILEWNTHRFLELYFSVPCIGGVLVALNPRLHTNELAYIIKHSGIKRIFFNSDFTDLITSIDRYLDISEYILLDRQSGDIDIEPLLFYDDLLKEKSKYYNFPVLNEKSAYAACYTSGTTGRPKGIFYSHRSTMLHSLIWAIHLNLSIRDVHLQLTPMFHALGWGLWLSFMIVGAMQIFPGRWMVKNPAPIVDIILDKGVTISEGVPTIWRAILDELDKRKFSGEIHMKAVLGGSSPNLKLIRRLRSYGMEVIHTYGFTEGNPITHRSILIPSLNKKCLENGDYALYQGLPAFLVRQVLIDKKGNEIKHGENKVGELIVRGPFISKNYYNYEEDDKAFIVWQSQRWFRTGDACIINECGYLKVVDRYNDMIKSGGEWISTIELENYLVNHPYIMEACVIGIPHDKWGERPLALIVPEDRFRGKLSDEDIYSYLLRKFPKWQLPDKLIYLDSIPKTGTGKYLKRVLKEKYGKEYR